MTATNHVLTGAVIAAGVQKPLLALPLALLSHVLCDWIPHFGNSKLAFNTKSFALYLGFDCGIAASILLAIIILQPQNWPLLVVCGILAASPDLLWIPDYLRALKGQPKRKRNGLEKFLGDIQWSQTPVLGTVVEVVWFVAMGSALLIYIF